MHILLISEMSRTRDTVIDHLGWKASGSVLIVDSAGIGAPGAPKARGGSAASAYRDMGAEVRVHDLLDEGPVSLDGVTVVHFTGGDPFRLLRACRATGFQSALETHAASHDLAVVGSSAGAMILGDEVGHAAILCRPVGLDGTRGFGWIEGRIMPHLDIPGARGDRIRAHVRDNPDEPWVLLHDDDCLEEVRLSSCMPSIG
jgi:hypothetical protein